MISGLIFIISGGYLLGSLTPSIWISKLIYKKDIRTCGSGNAGATNVFRTLGWKPALAVMIIDMTKGFIPVWFAADLWFSPENVAPVYLQLAAGIAAVLGHCYTVFGGFRGGKGVATAGGMMMALFPVVLPFCLLVFVVVVWITRYVSLGSIITSIALPIGLLASHYLFGRPVPAPLMIFALLVPLLIIFTHRSNVTRLLAGTEAKIGRPGTS